LGSIVAVAGSDGAVAAAAAGEVSYRLDGCGDGCSATRREKAAGCGGSSRWKRTAAAHDHVLCARIQAGNRSARWWRKHAQWQAIGEESLITRRAV